MLRMGIQYEMPEDTKCVEKRHAGRQVHHLQDVQADRELRVSGITPMNLEELKEFAKKRSE